MSMGWEEAHGYTNKCAGCGQTTDSTYCSWRCEADSRVLEDIGGEDEEEDGEDLDGLMVDGPGTGSPYGDENNEPNISHGDAKHERKEADRDELAYREQQEA